MSKPEVILYDLTSGDVPGKNVCWSLNPWKTRLALNYKKIEYSTEFLEYPDLRHFFSSRGLPPNPDATDSTTEYTIPTVQFTADGRYIMDSRKIIAELEKRFPSPSLHLDAPELQEVYKELGPAMGGLRFMIIPRIGRNVLTPVSAEYFQRTRKERFGMSLDEVEATMGGPDVLDAAKETWKPMAEIVSRHKEGPFVLGKEVSYADFVIVSAMIFARRGGEEIHQKIIQTYPVFGELYDACKPWMERDDH